MKCSNYRVCYECLFLYSENGDLNSKVYTEINHYIKTLRIFWKYRPNFNNYMVKYCILSASACKLMNLLTNLFLWWRAVNSKSPPFLALVEPESDDCPDSLLVVPTALLALCFVVDNNNRLPDFVFLLAFAVIDLGFIIVSSRAFDDFSKDDDEQDLVFFEFLLS